MRMRGSHFLLVEAERYLHLAGRTPDEQMAARWRRVAAEYEDLARRYDEHCEPEGVGPHIDFLSVAGA